MKLSKIYKTSKLLPFIKLKFNDDDNTLSNKRTTAIPEVSDILKIAAIDVRAKIICKQLFNPYQNISNFDQTFYQLINLKRQIFNTLTIQYNWWNSKTNHITPFLNQ